MMTGLGLGLAAGLGLALGTVLLWRRVAGFAAQPATHLADRGPALDIRRHLDGTILCEGVIYGPRGRVVSRFVADMEAHWEGDRGSMTETFRYDSGARQIRVWTLHLGPGGAVRAEAPDVIGTGRGRQAGAGLRLDYRIRLPEDAGGHVLAVTDWMYLMENGTIMNHSQFRKFGFKVAELVATMRRVAP